jgi:hypothetical protein
MEVGGAAEDAVEAEGGEGEGRGEQGAGDSDMVSGHRELS